MQEEQDILLAPKESLERLECSEQRVVTETLSIPFALAVLGSMVAVLYVNGWIDRRGVCSVLAGFWLVALGRLALALVRRHRARVRFAREIVCLKHYPGKPVAEAFVPRKDP